MGKTRPIRVQRVAGQRDRPFPTEAGGAHLHPHDEAGQVECRLPGVGHGGEVVEVGRPLVPVYHDDVQLLLLDQQLDDVVYPDWRSSGGPVAVDDEGGGAGQVEERLGGRVAVVQLAAAVQVGAGVEQQADVQAGSHEAVGQVEVGEVIAGLARATLLLAWTHDTTRWSNWRLHIEAARVFLFTKYSQRKSRQNKQKSGSTYGNR